LESLDPEREGVRYFGLNFANEAKKGHPKTKVEDWLDAAIAFDRGLARS
jgi:hypothetical protein